MKTYLVVRSGGLLIYKALRAEGGSGAAIMVRALSTSHGRYCYLIEGIDNDRYYLELENPPVFTIEKE